MPKLRIVSFDPLTGHKSVVLPVREAVLEAVGGEFGPLLEPWRRSELARCLVGYVVLRPLAKPTPSEPAHAAQKREIALPWSGDPEAALLKVRQVDRHPRQAGRGQAPSSSRGADQARLMRFVRLSVVVQSTQRRRAEGGRLEEKLLQLPGRLIQMGLTVEDLHVQVGGGSSQTHRLAKRPAIMGAVGAVPDDAPSLLLACC